MFVTGQGNKAWVSLPKGKGVKLSVRFSVQLFVRLVLIPFCRLLRSEINDDDKRRSLLKRVVFLNRKGRMKIQKTEAMLAGINLSPVCYRKLLTVCESFQFQIFFLSFLLSPRMIANSRATVSRSIPVVAHSSRTLTSSSLRSTPLNSEIPPKGIHQGRLTESARTLLDAHRLTAQNQLNSLLSTLNLSAKARAKAFSSALAALELERKLSEVGGKINKATGYEEIERLRLGVAERGQQNSVSCGPKLMSWCRKDLISSSRIGFDF